MRKVVTVRNTVTVESALATLAQNRILSAPMLTEGKGGNEAQHGGLECECFVDISDILASFLNSIDARAIKDTKMLAKMRTLEAEGVKFCAKTLQDVIEDLGNDGGFLLESQVAELTLLELVFAYLHPQSSKGIHSGGRSHGKVVHRLAIFNGQGDVTSVISQSDVIRFLDEHADSLGALADATVNDLGWADRAVLSVSPDTAAFDAMVEMSEKAVSALAVVNGGKLIGNFSASQLRSIMSEHFGSLALPVGEFLALEHGTEYAGYVGQPEESSPSVSVPSSDKADSQSQWARNTRRRTESEQPGADVGQSLVCVKASTSLREVLHLLTVHRLHRLYTVDDDLKPVGLVTCTDVLRMILKEADTNQPAQ